MDVYIILNDIFISALQTSQDVHRNLMMYSKKKNYYIALHCQWNICTMYYTKHLYTLKHFSAKAKSTLSTSKTAVSPVTGEYPLWAVDDEDELACC